VERETLCRFDSLILKDTRDHQRIQSSSVEYCLQPTSDCSTIALQQSTRRVMNVCTRVHQQEQIDKLTVAVADGIKAAGYNAVA